jgi:hypothetical protein
MQTGALDTEAVRRLGLDPQVVAEHQRKIRAQLERGSGVSFPIRESGTVQDGIVLRLDGFDAEAIAGFGHEGLRRGELCSFVPAAGAASRYLKAFDTLQAAVADGDEERTKSAAGALRSLGGLSELPFEVQPPEDGGQQAWVRYGLEVWRRYGELPKGLMPATVEGASFFELKLREQAALNPDGWMCVVVGEGKSEAFADELERSGVPAELKRRVAFLVQGRPLSTLRFDEQGQPVRQADGSYSPVVAGHGELLRLFPQAAELGSHRSVFIINVDNVIGASAEVQAQLRRFFGFHRRLLGLLDALREACRSRSVPAQAAEALGELCAGLGRPVPSGQGLELLGSVQRELFHSDLSELPGPDAAAWEALGRLYRRPLTVQGLVPNSGEDVGGIPVLIDLDGRRVKICLEMPHATPEDQEAYFRNPQRATHFNPVFVMHELCPQIPSAERTDPRFWMLTKKPYGGRDVYYHETVLYEAIGNSLTNNCVFVEIPRLLFTPHKVFTDTRGRTARSYGFEL